MRHRWHTWIRRAVSVNRRCSLHFQGCWPATGVNSRKFVGGGKNGGRHGTKGGTEVAQRSSERVAKGRNGES